MSSRRAQVVIASLALAALAAGILGSAEATGARGGKIRFTGALAIKRGKVPLQRKATALAPAPRKAFGDKGSAWYDGCLITDEAQVESGPCTYGDPGSDTSVVIFGDSRALSYSPALGRLSQRRGWKLVVLTRGLCSIADVPSYQPNCNQWRENTLERIETVEHPDLVLVGTSTLYLYGLGGGDFASMREGMVRTLERLKSTGAKLVVMRDQSYAPFEKPGECVAEHRRHLLACAWSPGPREARDYEQEAAQQVGARVIDVQRHVCRPKICPSVIGNVVVYRDLNHYSATFVRTLARWIGRRLPSLP